MPSRIDDVDVIDAVAEELAGYSLPALPRYGYDQGARKASASPRPLSLLNALLA